jgi:predicted DNA-binding transcriptional regulator AlpA
MGTTTTLTPEEFAREANRRLIDTLDLMEIVGLRSRGGLTHRIERGTLPPPIFTKGNTVLWDRDAIPNEGGSK